MIPTATHTPQADLRGTVDDLSAELRSALESERARERSDGFGAMRATGVTAAPIACDYGGLGLDACELNVLLERLACLDGSLAIVMFQHFAVSARIAEWGTSAQRAALLPRLASGEWLAASAWSETGAGAAKQRIATTARPSPAGWIIDGAKTFVTGATTAGILLVLATTSTGGESDGTYGTAGQSFFLVPAGTPGLVCQQGPALVGMRDSATSLVSLQECVVDDGALLGPLDEAPRVIAGVRRHGLALGAVATGLAQRAYELTCDHLRRSGQLPQDAVSNRLVSLRTRLEAARALVALAGDPTRNRSGAITLHAKIFASEIGEAVVTECQHLLGSAGYMRDHPIDVVGRDIRAVGLMGPSNELCRKLLAHEEKPRHGAEQLWAT